LGTWIVTLIPILEELTLEITPVIQRIRFRNAHYWVWRDDVYELIPGAKAFSGNKARKLYYYLNKEFPGVTTLVSYGSAQSNMLYSLSVLAQLKGWMLEFFVRHIPQDLVENPRGNYLRALKNGAKIQVAGVDNVQTWVEERVRDNSAVLYIPEGGRSIESEPGIALLAREIEQWVSLEGLVNPIIFLPSGTGTTAFYLQKHLSLDVLTCACVGSPDYLQEQFAELEPSAKRKPTILTPKRKYHFGNLYPEFQQIWQQLDTETGIEFDLLYDPLGWLCMLDYRIRNPGAELIFLHQGGQLGNQTMHARYVRKSGEG